MAAQVGFGDIGAVTAGEITYVCFTMVVGAVVHSIIVSEMIGVVTAMDTQQKDPWGAMWPAPLGIMLR